jgi:hypothetical protein
MPRIVPLKSNELATFKQIEYVEILFIDLEIFTSQARKTYIKNIVGREVAPIDLYKSEATLVINKLKEWKENKSGT